MTDLDPPWEVRASFYAGVGQEISLWASMEGLLIEVTAALLGTTRNKSGLVLYSIMNFHVWLNIIDDLFNLEPQHAHHRNTWTNISDDLRRMNDVRVRLAHHTVWGKSEKGTDFGLKPAEYDARTKSKKYAPLTSGELSEFMSAMEPVRERIQNLLVEMGARSRLHNALLGTPVRSLGDLPQEDAPPFPMPPKLEDPPESSQA
jgi:hypothetical protein